MTWSHRAIRRSAKRRSLPRPFSTLCFVGCVAFGSLVVGVSPVSAQRFTNDSGRYYPQSQLSQPGMMGQWAALAGQIPVGYFQPVRFELPAGGDVTLFAPSTAVAAKRPAPLMAELVVGRTYRFKISEMPGFPGLEIFPTVELFDRLHPPPGEAANFPIPIPITAEEIESALNGQLVNKIIFLEQPQLANPYSAANEVRTTTLPPETNLVEAADQQGRPLLLIRIGGRLPDPLRPEPAFFGSGAPLRLIEAAPPHPVDNVSQQGRRAQAITFTAAEARIEASDTTGDGLPVSAETRRLHRAGSLKVPGDEYLWDGGDRGIPVHHDGLYRYGLETEDTVAVYRNSQGQREVHPSNSVAVYAPRFAGVRSITGMEAGVSVARLAANQDARFGEGLRARVVSAQHRADDKVGGMKMRSRASGVLNDTIQDAVNQSTFPSMHVKLMNVYEDLNFIRTGQFESATQARLAHGLQAAFIWSRDQNPIIMASDAAANEVYAMFSLAEIVGLEEGRKAPGKLTIVKLADRETAQPGQIITFTIRYDNVGDKPVSEVQIVDHLTPRLEFIEGSGSSDRDGRLIVDEDGVGSVVLSFELAEPLPGQTGGVVTFQARVK